MNLSDRNGRYGHRHGGDDDADHRGTEGRQDEQPGHRQRFLGIRSAWRGLHQE